MESLDYAPANGRFQRPWASRTTMDSSGRVYVPSVLEAGGNAIGMGCFSTEQIAWEVLKTFLGKSEQMNLEQATIVAWDVDVVGENGMTVLIF